MNFKKIIFFFLLIIPIVTFSQCLTGNCQNGDGEYKFTNGLYTGKFINRQPHGDGVFSNKRGYLYNGAWLNGIKEGFGTESFKKGFSYEGYFSENERHGYGSAIFKDNRFMQNIKYSGEWLNGSMCGKGELRYDREVKYGRVKEIEKNILTGMFLNGVYQGRMTSPYPDELIWESFNLKMDHFQNFQTLTDKEYKKVKNPATIEGEIFLSCECVGGWLIFDAKAMLRKERSWWAFNIPTKTKSIILATRQAEFDIIEWQARVLKRELNREHLPCNQESLSFAWALLSLQNKECKKIRRAYTTETAWNPKRGGLKNTKIQIKWNNKISKNLKKLEKLNEKTLVKFNKKIEKNNQENCMPHPFDLNLSPINKAENIILAQNVETDEKTKEEEKKNSKNQKIEEKKRKVKADKEEKKRKVKADKEEKKRKEEEKKIKAQKKEEEKELKRLAKIAKKEARKLRRSQRSYVPQFPRAKQLE